MLETFQQGLLVEGKAAATINRRMAMLKHLFHKASDWNMVDDDTLRIVRKVKPLKEPPGRPRYLTPEEARRLLAEYKKRLLREIVTVALNTGMRRGEILALKWENVDLRNGYVQVVQSKNGESRTVPINRRGYGLQSTANFTIHFTVGLFTPPGSRGCRSKHLM